MEVFLDYLEEASLHYGQTKHTFNAIIKPLVIKLLDTNEWSEEEIVDDFVSEIRDYFYTEFKRCDICNEWNRIDDMPVGNQGNLRVCPTCREDGN